MLRPLRDQILRLSGYKVDSTLNPTEALTIFQSGAYDLVLVDVEGESGIHDAETLCSNVKTAKPTNPARPQLGVSSSIAPTKSYAQNSTPKPS